MNNNEQAPCYRDKSGQRFQGVTLEEYSALWNALQDSYSITLPQIVEASALSMAMVSRYALGLTASGAKVFAFVDDTPAGWVALATIRHLSNGGCDTAVLTYLGSDSVSAQFSLQAQALCALNVPIESFAGISADEFLFLLDSCHNVICGLYARNPKHNSAHQALIESINESRIPVHCIEAPLGVDVNSGLPLVTPLFASSTLSLGIPFAGLVAGHEFVGRHYVADISLPKNYYRFLSAQHQSLFSEQPVVQIYPDSGEMQGKMNLHELVGS